LWRWAVVFYGWALPLSLMSNLITFVPYNRPFARDLDGALIDSYPPIMHDIRKTVKVFNDFKDTGTDSWRILVVFWATVLPPICLVLELFLGKLKVPI